MRKLLHIAALLLCPTLAWAQSIPFNLGPNTVVGRGNIGSGEALALYGLIVPSDDERNLDPKKKFERDRLARRIYKNAHAMLSPEDVALIKERIGKTSSVVQVGAAWPLLDPTLADK